MKCDIENCNKCSLGQCSKCNDGYFLANNKCQKCHEACRTCTEKNQSDCISCNYSINSVTDDKCHLCNEFPGFFAVGNTCITRCGDGVIASSEQCDDGNTLNNDG
jgi:hypothetical protein